MYDNHPDNPFGEPMRNYEMKDDVIETYKDLGFPNSLEDLEKFCRALLQRLEAEEAKTWDAETQKQFIERVLLSVAEIPDRNSPADFPEAMLVTGPELKSILESHLPMMKRSTNAPQPNNSLTEIALHLQRWLDYNEQANKRDGITMTDDNHIITPPVWPDRGQIKAWIAALTRSTNTPTGMELLMNSDPAIGENYRRVPIEATNAPVGVPEGFCIMPKELTAGNGAKAALIGEFTEEMEYRGKTVHVDVSWTTIKEIYKAAVSLFAPQPPNSDSPSGEKPG